MRKYSDRLKILNSIRKAGFKLIKNIKNKEYELIEDWGKIYKDERLVK